MQLFLVTLVGLYLVVVGFLLGCILLYLKSEAHLKTLGISLVLGFLLETCILLPLAFLGLFFFDLILAINILVFGALVVLFLKKKRAVKITKMGWFDVVGLILCLGFAVMVFNAGENLVGNEDPATYYTSGVSLAKTGKLTVLEDVIPKSKENKQVYGSITQEYAGTVLRTYGYYLNSNGASLHPQFLHMLPAWIALLYDLGSFELASLTNPFLAVLALLAFMSLVVEITKSRVMGILCGFAFAVFLPQVWFAKQAFAEIPAQILLFGGLIALFKYETSKKRVALYLASVLLGLIVFCRFDAVFIFPIVCGYLLWQCTKSKSRAELGALLLYVAVSLLGLFSFWLFDSAYSGYLFAKAWQFVSGARYIALAVPVCGLVVWLWFRLTEKKKKLIKPVAAATLALALLGLSYFNNPYGAPTVFVQLAYYVCWPLLILGVCAQSYYLFFAKNRLVRLLAFMGLFFFAMVAYRNLIGDYQFWGARRFVLIIGPFLILFVGLVARGLLARLSAGRVLKGVLVTLVLAAQVVPTSLIFVGIVPFKENKGTTLQLQQLVSLLNKNDLVVFIEYNPLYLDRTLQVVYGIDSVFLKTEQGACLSGLKKIYKGKKRIVLASLGLYDLKSLGVTLTPLGTVEFKFSKWEKSTYALPFVEQTELQSYSFYTVNN